MRPKYLHIQHDPYSARVALLHKLVKIIISSKMRIDFVDVLLPVSMIAILGLLRYRRNPDSINPKTFVVTIKGSMEFIMIPVTLSIP